MQRQESKNVLEKSSKLEEMKGEVAGKLKEVEEHITEVNKLKNDSIDKLEQKKLRLRKLSDIQVIREEHAKALQELQETKAELEERRLSLAFMNQTVADLDKYEPLNNN